MKKTFAWLFQAYSKRSVLFALVTLHGPVYALVSSEQWCNHTNERTNLHEESHGGRASWTTVGPKDHIVTVGVASAFEKVEEQMPRFYVDVARVCPMVNM